MRAVAALAVTATALAVGCADAATPGSGTTLTVTYRAQGADGAATKWTLRCGPARGTHPARGRACKKLAQLGSDAFRPVPADAVCTQVFGGPDTALVTGTFRGRRVWARFSRTDGCQISRWNRHVPLVPAAGSV